MAGKTQRPGGIITPRTAQDTLISHLPRRAPTTAASVHVGGADPVEGAEVNGHAPRVATDDGEHLRAVRERQALPTERLQARLDAMERRRDATSEQQLLQQAQRASTARSRVLWLQRAADAVGRAATGSIACRRGCAHCCHIPVVISDAEARLIASKTGRALARPAERLTGWNLDDGDAALQTRLQAFQAQAQRRHLGRPCPFLAEGECSVYAVRPLACRLLFNLDDDALLCQLVEGEPIGVPYLDMTAHRAAGLAALGPGATYADIRDWFDAAAA